MKKLIVMISILLLTACATAPPVTQQSDYNLSCETIQRQIAELEPQVEREQDIQLGKQIVGGLVWIVGGAVSIYNSSWEGVTTSIIGGDIIEDWNSEAYRDKELRLTHLKQLARSKGCYE
jgi:hypothetical protein